jgi:tRNA 2-thiouridine synthesizing protein E
VSITGEKVLCNATKGDDTTMATLSFKGKTYDVDSDGFLLDTEEWDAGFAQGTAPNLGLSDGLTRKHWEVIHYIRSHFESEGMRPTISDVCHENGLDWFDLKRLFPTGYCGGACKLAGLSF